MAEQAAEIRFLANVDEFEKNVRRMERKVERSANRIAMKFERLGKSLEQAGQRLTLAITAPLVALGSKSLQAQKQFGDSVNKMNTLVGISRDQLKDWTTDFHRIGNTAAKNMGEIADAMFFITSAGQRGGTALDTLDKAAKGSAIGLGQTSVVADAATSAMNAYGEANLKAGDAVGILAATVKEGKAEAASIAPVLGNVIPIAAELGVEFHEVGASIAALTKTGNTAEASVAQLSGILAKMLKPSEQAKKELADVGLSMEDVRRSVDEEGLLATLEMLRAKFEGNSEGLARVFEDVQAVRGVLSLVGQNAEQTRQVFQNLANSGVKTLDDAFKELQQTDEFKYDRAVARMSNRLTRLGARVLPMVADVLDRVSLVLERLAAEFDKLSEKQQDMIIKWAAVAAAVGPVLGLLGMMANSMGGLIRVTVMLSGALWKTLRFALIGSVKLLGHTVKALRFVSVAIVGFVKTLVVAFGGVPVAIGVAIAAAIATILVFRNTVKEVFGTIWKIVSGKFNAGFQNYIVRPQIMAINELVDLLPDAITKRLGLKKIKVPPIIDGGDAGQIWAEGWSRAKKQALQDAEDAKTFVTDTVQSMKDRVKGLLPEGLADMIGGDFDALLEKMNTVMAPLTDEQPSGPENSTVLENSFKKAEEQAVESAKTIKAEMRDAALESAKEFETMNYRVEDRFRGVADSVKGIFSNMVNSIVNIAFRPLNMALNQMMNTVINGIFPGIGGAAGGASAGGKAGGGRIQPGVWTRINERGDEFVMPDRPMTVINNMDSKALMRGAAPAAPAMMKVEAKTPPTQVNVINASGGQVTTRRRRGSNMREIVDVIVGSSSDDVENGGNLAQSIERRYGLRPQGV